MADAQVMLVISAARGMLAFVILMAALVLCSSTGVEATLRSDFYSSSCPNVENLVYQAISKAYWSDSTVAPGILRLSFHDCFVNVSWPRAYIFTQCLSFVGATVSFMMYMHVPGLRVLMSVAN